jgi:hypothetical protein
MKRKSPSRRRCAQDVTVNSSHHHATRSFAQRNYLLKELTVE